MPVGADNPVGTADNPVVADAAARLEPVGGNQDQAPTSQVVDLAEAAPFWTPEVFGDVVQDMVAAEAPRLFAVVQELGTRVDVRVAAWGMAFEDSTEVIAVDRRIRASLRSPDRAARFFSRRPRITAHLEWVKPGHPVLGTES